MPSLLLLDSGPLAELCHRNPKIRMRIKDWCEEVLLNGDMIHIPEIADYEVRRKLLHLISRSQTSPTSLTRLDHFVTAFRYLAISTEMWRTAAELWSQARSQGFASSDSNSIDADVILAAQAREVGGVVVTTNARHLSRFVPVMEWPIIK